MVVMTLELDAGKPLGEHVLASFRTNTMYNADLVLKEPDFPMSPTQVTAYSDLVILWDWTGITAAGGDRG